MGDALFPKEATIYIVAADTDGSSLSSSDAVTGEISNFKQSGGVREVESIPVHGGGNIDKENPVSQIEVSFDVIPQYGSDVTRWDEYLYGSTLQSSGEGDDKAIYIEWSDGTNYYTRAYNNVKAVSFEPESSADEYFKGSMTFKLSPTTSNGTANLKIAAAAASTISW